MDSDLMEFINDKVVKVKMQEIAEKIKPQIKSKFQGAINEFYAVDSGGYNRTMSFLDTIKDPSESYSDMTLTLTYTFSSDDVSVNSWDAPWGITYDGNPEIAFATAFGVGYHGGPKPVGDSIGKKHWTWAITRRTTPIALLLLRSLDSLIV